MKDVAILMPCWKSPELLRVVIPSLIKASKSNYEIIVILNEADKESINYLISHEDSFN
jgi:glycosyltransferase involved in cell wall biosynthesis